MYALNNINSIQWQWKQGGGELHSLDRQQNTFVFLDMVVVPH